MRGYKQCTDNLEKTFMYVGSSEFQKQNIVRFQIDPSWEDFALFFTYFTQSTTYLGALNEIDTASQ